MGAAPSTAGVGELLREWRNRRHLSQLELALDANVSARHLSFVETGRSKPSRELLLALAEQLDVPLREQNHLLLAAGFAPVFNETPLEAEPMGPVREAIEKLLGSHEPFPAVIVDRGWNLVASNAPAQAILSDGVASHLLEPPVNAMRVSLHPEGLAPQMLNFSEWGGHMMDRLHRGALLSQDPALFELERELRTYPGVPDGPPPVDAGASVFVPFRLRRPSDGAELSFFSTIATFGTAVDITVEELSIESFYPADEATAKLLRDA